MSIGIWYSELVKALFSCAVGAAVLLPVGQWLTYRWNLRQKSREIQSSALQQFYAAYGEFFAIWKIWNHLSKFEQEHEIRRWELHLRAAAAEGVLESILVKLASEVELDTVMPDRKCTTDVLGCFRQAFQQLREAIRANKSLPWHDSDNPEYLAFKTLAVRISALLSGEWNGKKPSVDLAARQIRKITSNQWEHDWVRYCEEGG